MAMIENNPWIPVEPTIKQTNFLALTDREAMYGGQAGGGKSIAILIGGLMYVDVPRYAALILRRTYTDLAMPEAIMDVSHTWLEGTEAKWKEITKTWTFPSGARLTFGFLDTDRHKYRYQSTEFQYIGFDELTQFEESDYTYLFSRLRRKKNMGNVPLRMRAASNPGGIGHEWVRSRFIDGDKAFIPASMSDNPHLDIEEYEISLDELDPLTRRQLKYGDWDASQSGGLFQKHWFPLIDQSPDCSRLVRYWDFASTKPSKRNKDPDWTVGLLLGIKDKTYFICDIVRFRGTPAEVEERVKDTALRDGRRVPVWIEREPGSSGKIVTDNFVRSILPGYQVYGNPNTGSKSDRAKPVSGQAQIGNVHIVRGPWIVDFLNEVEAFPKGSHDDQVDALSGAFSKILSGGLKVH